VELTNKLATTTSEMEVKDQDMDKLRAEVAAFKAMMDAGPAKPADQDALKVGNEDVGKDSETVDGGSVKSGNDEVMKGGNAEEEQNDQKDSDPNMDSGNGTTPTASNDAIPPSGYDPAVVSEPKYFSATEEDQAQYDQAADPNVKLVRYA